MHRRTDEFCLFVSTDASRYLSAFIFRDISFYSPKDIKHKTKLMSRSTEREFNIEPQRKFKISIHRKRPVPIEAVKWPRKDRAKYNAGNCRTLCKINALFKPPPPRELRERPRHQIRRPLDMVCFLLYPDRDPEQLLGITQLRPM